MLVRRGYKVRAVTSGTRALEAVQANLPDVILLDIMMPEMNGYEVCERLKSDEQTGDIPIIFISALDATEDKVNAFAAGGVDYVTKPFQPAEVIARVETHLTLRNLQKSLQQEIAELDAFATTVAHDLKNPLNTISGYAAVLVELAKEYDTTLEGELQHASQRIVQGVQKMDTIIESLLLLAGVRKQEVTFEPLNMSAILVEVQHRISGMIEDTLAEVILPETWPTAQGYGPWVEEVWVNYISNAIKYGGQPPRVELGASSFSASAAGGENARAEGQVRFWVRDNGPGLSPEQQERLFTPFERLGQTRLPGHGLGLSIVLRIVEKLGGEVSVESEMGRGSVFFFTLPSG
jgi:two-component system sensor histidine kinase/response regulator